MLASENGEQFRAKGIFVNPQNYHCLWDYPLLASWVSNYCEISPSPPSPHTNPMKQNLQHGKQSDFCTNESMDAVSCVPNSSCRTRTLPGCASKKTCPVILVDRMSVVIGLTAGGSGSFHSQPGRGQLGDENLQPSIQHQQLPWERTVSFPF